MFAVTWAEGALAIGAVVAAVASAATIVINRQMAERQAVEARRLAEQQAADARRLATIEAKRGVYADVIRALEDAAAILDIGSETNQVPSGALDDRVRHARALVLVLGGPKVQSRYADAAEAVRSRGSVRIDGTDETNPRRLHANIQERIQALADAMRAELDD